VELFPVAAVAVVDLEDTSVGTEMRLEAAEVVVEATEPQAAKVLPHSPLRVRMELRER
jgi:hypothetical protein